MADIPLVQEAPEQEKKGNEGFCIRIIRTQATGISLENIQRITLLLQKKDIRTVNREFVSRKIAFLIVILMVLLLGIKKY